MSCRPLLAVLLLALAHVAGAREPVRINVVFQEPLSTFCEAILTEAFARLGEPLEIRSDLPAERAIRRVSRGRDDGDCMRVQSVAGMYPNLIQVPTRIFDVEFTAFTREGVSLARGWGALKPYRVGAVKGWKLIETQVGAVKPRSFVQVRTGESLFRMLELGRVDVAALSRLDGERLLRRLKLKGIAAADAPLAAVPLFVTLHRSHGTLARELDQTFLAMQRDGTWARLRQQSLGSVGG